MSTFSLSEACDAFGDQLVAFHGFDRVQRNKFRGNPFTYPGTDLKPTIEIDLVDGFPYRRPNVSILEASFTAQSWHLNVDPEDPSRGYLCLYGNDGGNSDYPWCDPSVLLRRIGEWIDNDANGWPGDLPVLDVNSYLPQSHDQLVVHAGRVLEGANPNFAVKRRGEYIWETTEMGDRDNSPESSESWFAESVPAFMIDVGEVRTAPRSAEDLLSGASDRDRRTLHERLADSQLLVVLVKYRRGENAGLLALQAFATASDVQFLAFRETHELTSTGWQLRAGRQALALGALPITIVGLGAVGSFLADTLVRCGARVLELYDGDVLKPGNCVRHLCNTQYVGYTKSFAVRQHLITTHRDIPDLAITAFGKLMRPIDFEDILSRSWLTIDATADETVIGLLTEAAGQRNLLSVCVLGEGQYVRCDRWPTQDGHAESPNLRPFVGELQYEGGCGDPVSQTAPYVPQAAAALACRMSLDLLSDCGPSLPTTMIIETS